MTKENKIKFIITFIIFLISIYFIGFFSAKSVYAKTLYDETITSDKAKDEVEKILGYSENVGYKYAFFSYSTTFGRYEIYISKYPFKMATSGYFMSAYPTKGYISSTGTSFTLSDGTTHIGNTTNQGVYFGDGYVLNTSGTNYCIYSTDSIYYEDGKTFFSVTVLDKVTTQPTLRPVLSQILALVPILVSLVVGWIALRKGLQVLGTLLHQA